MGATLRTLLFVAGMGVLFVGIATYAFPSLGAAVVPTTGVESNPNPAAPGGGPSTLPSIAAIVSGLLLTGSALAVPGRSSLPFVPHQRYTGRQRATVLLGGLCSVALPAGLLVAVQRDPSYVTWLIPVAALAVVGALLVLVGTALGLS